MGRGGNRKNILCTPHGNEKNTFLAIGNGCQLAMLPLLPLLLQFLCSNIICIQQIRLTAAVSVAIACNCSL